MCAGEQLLGRKYQAFYLGLGLSPIVSWCLPSMPCLANVCPATTAACVISKMGGPRRLGGGVAFLVLFLFGQIPDVVVVVAVVMVLVGGWVSELGGTILTRQTGGPCLWHMGAAASQSVSQPSLFSRAGLIYFYIVYIHDFLVICGILVSHI